MFVPRKSILMSKPPHTFPQCWSHVPDENEPLDDYENIPQYDYDLTRDAMNRSTKLCESTRNANTEDDDWETKILKYGWTPKHINLFNSIVKVLDYDRLSRLAYIDNKRYEAVQRRNTIDKSAERMRKCLASVAWDTPMVQWIHGLMMEYLPPSYLAAYIDIMQSLKNKLPSLVDKMIFWKPGNVVQELLAPILKKPWHPILNNKYRKLPGNALLVVIPSAAPKLGPQSSRLSKLYTLFTTLAPMLPVQLNVNNFAAQKQTLQSIAEQTVSITRTKIQELRAENPDRRLILVGMSSASALAIQVALVEQVSGVVCFGFSYNTVHGVRGQPDDHFLELSTPTLFLVGQNASRCSEEEIEYFREKLTAPTSTVVVGAADDYLRVSKTKRRLEGVTQEMVDNMIVDEIADFATKCVQRPLPARPKTAIVSIPRREIDSSTGQVRKRKLEDHEVTKGMTIKSQKLMRPTSTSDDVLDIAVQSILPDQEERPQIPQIKTHRFVAASGRVVQSIGPQRMRVINTQFAQTRPSSGEYKFVTISGQKTSKVVQKPYRPSRPSSPTQQQGRGKIPFIQQQSFSPTKYTIVRHSNSQSKGLAQVSETSTDLTGANIFDMPIVFADNEGNIDEEASTMSDGSVISVASDSPPAATKQVIVKTSTVSSFVPSTSTPSYTVTKNKNILIQKPATGKVFMLNGSVVGKPFSANNIVMPKPSLAQQIRVQKFGPASIMKSAPPISAAKKIEVLNTAIIKPASSVTRMQGPSFVNLADGKRFPGTRLSLPITTATLTNKNQIVIKSNSLKPYTGTQILPSSLSGNKQLGNLTVKRLNVVPSATITKVFKES